MSKHKLFNTIKRRILPASLGQGGLALPRKVSVKRSYSWPDSFWAKQLKGIETLGSGLVVMRMG